MTLSSLDARVKLFVMLAVSSVSVFSRSLIRLALLLVLTLLLLLLGRADLRDVGRRVAGVLKLIFSLFVLQCLFMRTGEPLLHVFGVTLVTWGGLETAAVVSLRLVIVVASAAVMLSGQTRDYLLALQQMHLPYELAFMVLAALRFVPLLRETAADVLCAVQMRGTKLKKTSLRNKARVYISVLIPIVAGAIRRSEQLSTAMEARAFRAEPHRTNMRKLTMRPRDWLYIACLTAVLAALVVWL